MDTRLTMLTQWVRDLPGFDQATPEPVSGDASFRRYFRVSGDLDGTGPQPYVVMDAPPEHEDCRPFVAIAHHWRSLDIAVPDIVHEDLTRGFLLLEDFGDALMLGAVNQANADRLYGAAMDELVHIQRADDSSDYPLPAYDIALLDREMALFPDWLLTQQLGLALSNGERALLDTTFAFLRESALAQPDVAVHRDYHSRNLLVRPDTTRPGVIDFQDAVRGPITYDLVSLLKDCYVRWPEDRVNQWTEYFRVLSAEAGLHKADSDTFRQWFELMGMQRHLKAAGIFARLAIRDGKTSFLKDVPRTVGYLVEASSRQAALRHFHEWLTDTVVPPIEQQIGPVETSGQ
jgi:aminoglycoside/choline kinase family phosphotransferase